MEVPLVPTVMCLAKRNGVGMRIPIEDAKQHVGSMFCETCPARVPCYAHNSVDSKKPSLMNR